MTDLSILIKQIEELSPESQTQLATYVEFLHWKEKQAQAQKPHQWSFSFIEGFKEAATYATDDSAGMELNLGSATVGGQSRAALWAHPPVVGQAIIEYHVPIPQNIQNIQLNFAIGIRDGAKIDEMNLVAFGIKVNGLRVWGDQINSSHWQEIEIPLDLVSGDMARIEFSTEALGSHEWTWAVWGSPELIGSRT